MYLTKEDYFKYSGINLEFELHNSATDNPSKAVEIFINQAEEWLLEYMLENFEVDTDNLDKEVMKKVMCYQIDWLRRNGDLSMDSDFTGCNLSPNAERVLRINGYANIKRDGLFYGYKH